MTTSSFPVAVCAELNTSEGTPQGDHDLVVVRGLVIQEQNDDVVAGPGSLEETLRHAGSYTQPFELYSEACAA